jgi:hypothetical protein
MFIEIYTAALLLLGVAMSGLAQDKPDFSGEWILNRQASTLSPGADNVLSGVWRIEHHEPTFHHKAALVTAGKPIEYEYELRSDVTVVVGDQQRASLRWDGSALVVTFRTPRAGGEMKITYRYELLDAGRRLRASEQVRGTDHDQDNVWMFDRR